MQVLVLAVQNAVEYAELGVATSGATGMQQMGVAMKAANAAVAGRAEGGRVAAVVRQVLAG